MATHFGIFPWSICGQRSLAVYIVHGFTNSQTRLSDQACAPFSTAVMSLCQQLIGSVCLRALPSQDWRPSFFFPPALNALFLPLETQISFSEK